MKTMSVTARTMTLAVACSLWACTAPSVPSPAPEPASTAEAPEISLNPADVFATRTVLTPTADMLEAALTGDPEVMRQAVAATTASSCVAASTCPSQFASCTNFSSPSLCSSTCGESFCFCRPIRLCEGEPPEPRQVDIFNSFRICFDPAGNSCTEWQQTISSFCGC
jgi:hypothetical protein